MKQAAIFFLCAVTVFAQQADFTIALVPDVHINEGTQYATSVGNWITAHLVADWNGVAVAGAGDFDGQNTNNTTKQSNINSAYSLIYSKIDALGLPRITAIGNHDYDNDSPSGRLSTLFDGSQLGYTFLSAQSYFGGYWSSDPTGQSNTWMKFSVGVYKFGAIATELFPRAGALSWAQSVMAANTDRQFIYVSHSIQDCTTWVTAGDSFGGNAYGLGSDSQGAAQRDAVTAEPNAIIGFNGHYIGCGSTGLSIHTAYTGTSGKPVTFIRSNWQETDPDVLTLLKFRPSLNEIEVHYIHTPDNTELTSTYPMYTISWTPLVGAVKSRGRVVGRARMISGARM